MAFAAATKQSTQAASAAPLLDAGGYNARIVQIIDLGLQPGSGQYPTPALKLLFKFELLDEFMCEVDDKGVLKQVANEDGDMEYVPITNKPRWFDFEFTYNADGFMGDRSHIYKLHAAVDAFEVLANPEMNIAGHPAKALKDLVGEPLVVNLIQTTAKSGKNAGKPVNKISAFAAMKGKDKKVAPALVNEGLFFDMDEPDVEVFKKLPNGNQWCPQERIKAGLEYGQSKLAALLGESKAAPVQETVVTEAEVDAEMQKELEAQAAAREAAAAAGGQTDAEVPF